MNILNESTVVVYNSEQLKTALEVDNGYTNIFLGANIELASGINISKTKSLITIDGTYNNTTYTFTDRKSTAASDTISIQSANTLKVIVQNINIVSYNYYGIIYVPENNTYKNVIVEYNNITYIGPQISFHPTGLTRFINSNITVQTNYSTGNEVAECNKIEIGGNTTITHKSTANSSFWFRNSDPEFKILPNATVNFISENRELFYGVNNLILTVSENSYFNINTHNGMGYGSFGTGNTNIEKNATLIIKQTARNGSYPTWYSYGIITINEGAILNMINDYANLSSSNYNIYFNGTESGIILNNPKEIILSNSVANTIYTNSTINFTFNFNRINLFNDIINYKNSISLETLPTYSWYKDNGSSQLIGTITSSTTKIISHNYTESELTGLPNLSNFILNNKKIISTGLISLHIDSLTDTDTNMSGITDKNASVLIQYNGLSEIVNADLNGNYVYNYTDPLPIGTAITITSKENNKPIYTTKQIQIVYAGELVITSATETLNFKLTPINTNPIICPRESNIEIIVTDSRVNSSNWKLYATINHDLSSNDNKLLKDSIVFKNNNDYKTLSLDKLLVYTGENNNGETKVTTINWNIDEGILLQITNYIENNTTYTCTIYWSIEE